MRRAALALLPLVWLVACTSPPQIDLVLAGGRVIDPETGLDAIRNVGISGDTITRVSEERLEGTRTIEATSLVVAPGFIDLHQHDHSQDAYWLMALDGVTAAFELEVGVPDMGRFIDARRGRSPIHFGASASYLAARLLAWDMSLPASTLGPDAGIIPQSGPATNEAASPERFAHILETLGTQIESGALGVGIGLEVLAWFDAARGDRRLSIGREPPGSHLRPRAQQRTRRAWLESRVRERGHWGRSDQRRGRPYRPCQ